MLFVDTLCVLKMNDVRRMHHHIKCYIKYNYWNGKVLSIPSVCAVFVNEIDRNVP